MTPENYDDRQQKVRVLRRRSDTAYAVFIVALLTMAVFNGIINYRQEQNIKNLKVQIVDLSETHREIESLRQQLRELRNEKLNHKPPEAK